MSKHTTRYMRTICAALGVALAGSLGGCVAGGGGFGSYQATGFEPTLSGAARAIRTANRDHNQFRQGYIANTPHLDLITYDPHPMGAPSLRNRSIRMAYPELVDASVCGTFISPTGVDEENRICVPLDDVERIVVAVNPELF